MAIAESPKERSQFRDHRYSSRLGRGVENALSIPQPNFPLRRAIGARILDTRLIFPHAVAEIQGNAVERTVKLMRDEGYGLVAMFFPHRLARDAGEAPKDLLLLHEYFTTRAIAIPFAWHIWEKYQRAGLRHAKDYFDFQLFPVVTVHTRELHADYKTPSLIDRARTVFEYALPPRLGGREMTKEEYERRMSRVQISREERGEWLDAYLNTSAEVLGNRGITILAPEAERGPRLQRFRRLAPVRTLVNAAGAMGFDKIAFLVIGLEEEGSDNDQVGNLAIGKRIKLKVAPSITLTEANKEVTRQNVELIKNDQKPTIVLEDLIYDMALTVIPEGAKPKAPKQESDATTASE